MAQTEDELIAHPAHYCSHPSGIQHIEITERMGFCLGNAFKYLFRRKMKGMEHADLKEALWYVQREIAWRNGHGLSEMREARLSAFAADPEGTALLERVGVEEPIRILFIMRAIWQAAIIGSGTQILTEAVRLLGIEIEDVEAAHADTAA